MRVRGTPKWEAILLRPEFVNAPIVITECTFFESDHKKRAAVGKHIHLDNLADLLQVWRAKHVVITHTSRRTDLGKIKQAIEERVGCDDVRRIHLLMDHRSNRSRYEKQVAEDEELIETVDE